MSDATAAQLGTTMHVAITGASGLIGGALCEALEARGARVHALVRHAPRPGSGEIAWNPAREEIDAGALEGLDAVVHLAGESIAQRWSAGARRRIRVSRVQGTGLVARALVKLERPPHTLVSASAVGYYGDTGDRRVSEDSPRGAGYLAGICEQWEAAADEAALAGVRVVHARFGPVLSPHGGMLARLLPIFRLGLGGRLGTGRQWVSWVALADAVRALIFALENPVLSGPVNVVSSNPVTNAELTRALGRALARPTAVRVPARALVLLYGEMARETLLAGQRVTPARLIESGFSFAHSELDEALEAMDL